MSKLLSLLIAATFATVSAGALAMSHGGAPKDEKKADSTEMKEEAKADSKEMKDTTAMKGEKKADKKKMKDEKKAAY